jgi:hypothetical protein
VLGSVILKRVFIHPSPLLFSRLLSASGKSMFVL